MGLDVARADAYYQRALQHYPPGDPGGPAVLGRPRYVLVQTTLSPPRQLGPSTTWAKQATAGKASPTQRQWPAWAGSTCCCGPRKRPASRGIFGVR
jgi:hypothetical protein